MEEGRSKLSGITGGNFFVFSFPTVPGFSNVEALDIVLQDKTGGKLDKFSGISQQLQLDINDDKTDQPGVSVKDIPETMEAYFGSVRASDFNRFGKYYRVVIQADIADRADPSSIDHVCKK